MTPTDPSEPAAPAHGSHRSALEKAARKVDEFANKASQLHKHGLQLQISQLLLRYVVVRACQHALEVEPASLIHLETYDAVLRKAWEQVMGLQFSDRSWKLAQLPLREGGLSAGAISSPLPRAAAAYAAVWSRTAKFVANHLGLNSVEELLEQDGTLLEQLKAAAVALRNAGGLRDDLVPWADGRPPPAKFRQSQILKPIGSYLRKTYLD